MPENEKNEAATEKVDSGGIMVGKRGWIILFIVVVLNVLATLTLLHFKEKELQKQTAEEEAIPQRPLDDFMKKSVTIADLNHSKQTQTGQLMTISASLILVMEPTDDEIQRKIKLPEEDWAAFESAVKKMDPLIRDRIVRYLDNQDLTELRTSRGKAMLCDMVKDYVNGELEKIELNLKTKDISRRRISRVLIGQFIIQ